MSEFAERRDLVDTAREVDELLLRLNGLVRVRNLLAGRGAGATDLDELNAEIGRLQWRVAGIVREQRSDDRPRDAA